MAETIMFNIATVLKNLGSAALSEVASAWGFKPQLDKLKKTINTLKNVLLDAEERQADSHRIRDWLERLTTVVYAADDLFDEFATFVARKQHSGGNRVTKEVSTFFSSSNQIALAFKFSHNIEKIRQELDDIVEHGNQFSFLIRDGGREVNTGMKRDETYSFVGADEVIGRDGDKKAVLDLLLPSSIIDEHDEDLPVIPIVGMGGMGKTALAQLVYNDPKVCENFELKLWVCVSDDFHIKVIVEKLLKSATNKKPEELEMDQLQAMLHKEISDKKYLLVLDDVWNEDREKWVKLKDLLKIGRLGCKVLVTTRSRKVAKIMGTVPLYELQGLSEVKAWDLFVKVAFEPGQSQQKPHLVKIGEEILKKCANVPLAIRTLGSLLYGEDDNKWLSLAKDTSLANISDNQSDIKSILKFSYYHLLSPLKHCFAYCAVFPKDYLFNKEQLIELWMAEGFIIAAGEGQSLEDVGEEYFLVLLQRGFFQDVQRNEWGDITECKMHDLMHDLAQDVAGLKCKAAKFRERNFDDKIVHLSFGNPLSSSEEIPINNILNLKLLRTFLLLGKYSPSMLISQQLVMRLSNLRVLDLKRLSLKSLSSSIGKLIHLRYLDISENEDIQKLPNSITNLWNLQTLILAECINLRTLPENMRKLTNLRRLDVSGCNLSHMPSGMEGLTLLTKLPYFIVGHKSSTSNVKGKPTSHAKLSDLKNLNNLRGVLNIKISRTSEKNMLEAAKEADLSSKPRLTRLEISFYNENGIDDEAVLEGLKPHSNIRSLDIVYYSGQLLPSWARMDNLCITLPNLVHISLDGFIHGRCKELPTMSQLCNLKQLKISWMESVEYMEGNNSSSSLFFPSLQVLELRWMTNLKGWWEEGEAIMESHNNNELQEDASYEIMRGQRQLMQFSKLSKLSIFECPNLRMLPLCPNVEDLELRDTNESLSVLNMVTNTTRMISNSCSSGSGLNLKRLVIENAEHLMSLPIHSLQHLSYLKIHRDMKLESSERLGEVFATLSSSLKTLEFSKCFKLRSISKGLEHLTALENLNLSFCTELDIKGKEGADNGMPWISLNTNLRSLSLDGGIGKGMPWISLNTNLRSLSLDSGIGKGMPWIALNTSLRSLELCSLDKLVDLPSGLHHLSNLRSLTLSYIKELKEVPEWISCLTSLTYLELCSLDKLVDLPSGLQHLSNLRSLTLSRNKELKEVPECISCLTSLTYLELYRCDKLKSLPEGIRNLTTLNQLKIIECIGLTERCQSPNGSDWPKIQHIPFVHVRDCDELDKILQIF